MGIAALIALLPELLVTLPKIGEGIYNLLNANKDQLPEEQRAALDRVKARQAVEDEEWDRTAPGAGDLSAPVVTWVPAVPRTDETVDPSGSIPPPVDAET